MSLACYASYAVLGRPRLGLPLTCLVPLFSLQYTHAGQEQPALAGLLDAVMWLLDQKTLGLDTGAGALCS